MGILYKTVIISFLSLSVPFCSVGQIVCVFNLHNHTETEMNRLVLQFWKQTHCFNKDFPVLAINNLFVSVCFSNNEHIQSSSLDSSFSAALEETTDIILTLSHLNIDNDQIMMVHQCKIYLIDMRYPLQQIIDSISKYDELPKYLLSAVIKQIQLVHKSNWFINHWSDRDSDILLNDFYYIDDLFIKDENHSIKTYNPKEW